MTGKASRSVENISEQKSCEDFKGVSAFKIGCEIKSEVMTSLRGLRQRQIDYSKSVHFKKP